MLVLAIDTSAAQCAACVFDTDADREAGRSVIDLGKGHAEHLMTVIDAALKQAGIDYSALNRIAVSVGPGSFTGVRVGVSTARGLAMALKISAVGISTLEAVAAETREDQQVEVFAAFESVGGALQAALYGKSGEELLSPTIIDLDEATSIAAQHKPVMAGNAARQIAEASKIPLVIGSERNTADIGIYARLGSTKKDSAERPKPLYLREPDAKPQAGFVLPRA